MLEFLRLKVFAMESPRVEQEVVNKTQWPFTSFVHKASSVPLVSDTASYIGSKYNSVKSSNELLESLIGGAEKSVTVITGAAFGLTRNVLPYDYADKLACKGLDEVEKLAPVIKKPTKEIWNESSIYVLSTISGIKDEKKLPNDVCAAISARISSLMPHTASKLSIGECFSSLAHKILDKMEIILDYFFPTKKRTPKKKSGARALEEEVIKRAKLLIADLKRRLILLANHAAENKGVVPEDTESVNIVHITDILEYSLSKLYKKLQTAPVNEKKIKKVFRLPALVVVGTALSVMGAIVATLPKAEHLATTSIQKTKAALYATYKLVEYIAVSLRMYYPFLDNLTNILKMIGSKTGKQSKQLINFIRKELKRIMEYLASIEIKCPKMEITKPMEVEESGQSSKNDGAEAEPGQEGVLADATVGATADH